MCSYHITEIYNVLPHIHQILVDDESTHVKIFYTHDGTQTQALPQTIL